MAYNDLLLENLWFCCIVCVFKANRGRFVTIISLRQLLDHAAEHAFALPAFNVNNLGEHRAIMQAASSTNSPVILQASYGARKYAGPNFLQGLYEPLCLSGPRFPFACIRIMAGLRLCVCVLFKMAFHRL